MIESKAFRACSYGVYLVSAVSDKDGKEAGCVINTFTQATSKPPQISVAINNDNFTASVVKESGKFVVTTLSESAPMEFIGLFGFKSSKDVDKFSTFPVKRDSEGIPYVTESAVAAFSVRVSNAIDLGSHTLFIGEVYEASVLSDEQPMTYAYYHQVKGGKTPPKASAYIEPEQDNKKSEESKGEKMKYAWLCTVCGYIEYLDELPEDYTCPVCGVGKDMFEKIEVEEED